MSICGPFDADQSCRTMVFYLIGAVVLITDIIAVPIGSWLLSKDLWLPYYFSTPIILLAYPILMAIPETRVKARYKPLSDSPNNNDQISAISVEVIMMSLYVF
jgi:hypothetical protein